jgi:hypothetical protein
MIYLLRAVLSGQAIRLAFGERPDSTGYARGMLNIKYSICIGDGQISDLSLRFVAWASCP